MVNAGGLAPNAARQQARVTEVSGWGSCAPDFLLLIRFSIARGDMVSRGKNPTTHTPPVLGIWLRPQADYRCVLLLMRPSRLPLRA